MVTIKDVARRAGVSPSTVSKHLNGGHVRQENVESIQAAVRELNYRANPFARNLKTQRSRSIGMLLPDLGATFYSAIFAAVDKVLRQNGYHTLISCYNADYGLERNYLNFLLNTGVDGLIYIPENLTCEEFQEFTANRNVPIVQVDRMIPGISADAVLAENTEASYQAVKRLIARGHRRIAVVGGPHSIQTAKERVAGYLRALEEHGILYDGALSVSTELSFAGGYQSFIKLMKLKKPPTAILSTNYNITMGVITAARERGYSIPGEVDVFGYDCVDVCSMMTPPLPVVHQPEQEIGATAAKFLIERLNGYNGESRVVRLKCDLF